MTELATKTDTEEEIIVEQSVPEASTDPEIELSDSNEKQETPKVTEQKTKTFDPKTDKVEFTTPEQQQKFDYIYKQTKMSDTRNQMLTDLLQTQQQRLDELENRFKNTDSADAERILMGKIQEARSRGDDASEFAAINELVEFKADKKLTERVTQSRPQYQTQGPINPADIQYTEQFMYAHDDSGNLLRPWIQDGHPDQAEAIQFIEQAKQKYAGDAYALPKTLAELDNYMKGKSVTQKTPPAQPNSRAPSPMSGGNLTNTSGKQTIKMTRAELDIARKLGVDPKKYAAKRDELSRRK